MIYTIKLPKECMRDCSSQGACDEAVSFWLKNRKVRESIMQVPTDELAAILREVGAWDTDELSDDESNRERILWIVACDMKENGCLQSRRKTIEWSIGG